MQATPGAGAPSASSGREGRAAHARPGGDAQPGSAAEGASEPTPEVADRSPLVSAAAVQQITRTLDAEVFPRVVRHHGPAPQAGVVRKDDVQLLVERLLGDNPAEVQALVYRLRQRGVAVATIYLDLLAAAARELGDMWADDRTDFATVTWVVGRLHSLMRGLGPEFAVEAPSVVCDRHILFAQPPGEQHAFGLSMLADFFRCHGWTVLGGVGGTVADPAAVVRHEAVDAVGFSVGSEVRLPWLTSMIAEVRLHARRRDLIVLVGGPIFVVKPLLAQQVGADGTAADARSALELMDRLVPDRRAGA